jgi:hypothetical protein
MKEFRLFIRKQSNREQTRSPEQHHAFLKNCESYIDKLESEARLISAQPIDWHGNIISHNNGSWSNTPFNETREVIGGYYHIRAPDLEEAIATAKANPEFQYNPDTRIEVRPVKMKEERTGFTYPSRQTAGRKEWPQPVMAFTCRSGGWYFGKESDSHLIRVFPQYKRGSHERKECSTPFFVLHLL